MTREQIVILLEEAIDDLLKKYKGQDNLEPPLNASVL